ncbi:MAG: hypothetical protein LBV44_04130 [Methylobacillus sp.]|jgi:hypothetical protein|nr:hypothetical protein [Methylobacillus sp.]
MMKKIVLIFVLVSAVSLFGCEKTKTSDTQAAAEPKTAQTEQPAAQTKLQASDGPFGLSQGITLEQSQKIMPLKKEGDFVYSTPKVPSPHNAFENYMLVITPQHGLCKITAIGNAINNDAYGDSIREKFDTLLEALSQKYGKVEKFDYLNADSIWSKPRDWMMGLVTEERRLAAFWMRGDKGVSLPSEIASIGIHAKGLRSDSGYITLDYEFSNFDDCFEWVETQSNSAL